MKYQNFGDAEYAQFLLDGKIEYSPSKPAGEHITLPTSSEALSIFRDRLVRFLKTQPDVLIRDFSEDTIVVEISDVDGQVELSTIGFEVCERVIFGGIVCRGRVRPGQECSTCHVEGTSR